MKTTQLNLSVVMAAVAASASLACSESVDSEFIRTGGMYADYEAISDGTETTVTAQLLVGGDDGTTVKLGSTDRLIGTVGDEEKRLGSIGSDRYRSDFEEVAGGTPVVVSFIRGDEDTDEEDDEDGDVDAPDSEGTLPEPFTLSLTDVDAGDDIQRGEAVAFEWEPSGGGDISWRIEGDCIWTERGSTSDDGSFEISADDVRVQSTDEGEDCEVTLIVDRANEGDTDPAFQEGGSFDLIQRRTVRFNSTPEPGEGEEE